MKDLIYWIWLSNALTPGTEAYAKLRHAFSSPKEIYHADADALRRVLGIKNRMTLVALSDKNLRRAEEILDFAAMHHVGILTYDDERFPKRLREIKNPPVLLYYAGTLPDFDTEFFVAMVGSREHNDYGEKMTFEMGHDLAAGGATIISGLAYGIDSIALAAALDGGGRAVAVLGSGIDIIYPKEHVKLARLIARKGVVLTEFAPGIKPNGVNFPVRNRIISALSHVVLVTSATLHSGALITAHHAYEQKRQIYALPGNVDDIYCEGTALLLREGAKAAVCAEDILFAYEKSFPGIINMFRLLEAPPGNCEKTLAWAKVVSKGKKRKEPRGKTLPTPSDTLTTGGDAVASDPEKEMRREALESLDAFTRSVYEQIPETGDCLCDSITVEGAASVKVTVAITKLEIKHLVEILPGGRIARTDRSE